MKSSAVLLSAMAMITIGCAAVLNSRYDYDVFVKNVGKNPIPDCEIASASGFWHAPGYLSPGASASTAGPFKYPYADKWTVTWQTVNGQKLEKTLDLTKAFPRSFEGRLVFTIDATNGVSYYTTNRPHFPVR